jgi:hypothetical protein
MPEGAIQFSGIVLFTGMDQFPDDVVLSLGEIRKWALSQGLIADPDFQLLLDERIDTLSGHFGLEDQLQIALAIHPGGGEPFYLEYPYLPVKTLIRRGEEVELYYWRMIPTRWDSNGNILHFGETRFGFLLSGCTEEICSLSTAKLIVEKLHSLLSDLSDEYQVEVFPDGSREITVDGAVLARFVKEGRFFDILLSSKHQSVS